MFQLILHPGNLGSEEIYFFIPLPHTNQAFNLKIKRELTIPTFPPFSFLLS